MPNLQDHVTADAASGLDFLHCDRVRICRATVDKRFDYHTLQFMDRGTVELFYGSRRFEMRSGGRSGNGGWAWPCMPIAEPGAGGGASRIRFHALDPKRSWSHRYVAFTGGRVSRWRGAGLWPDKPVPVARGDAAALRARFDELLAEAKRPGAWSGLLATNLLERILIDLAMWSRGTRDAGPGAARDEATRPREAWLKDAGAVFSDAGTRLDASVLAAVAERHAMSVSTLRKKFRAATGEPIARYHARHRVAEACRLLGETETPIKRIADTLGYHDVFHFTRRFRQGTGVSPARYRRSCQR